MSAIWSVQGVVSTFGKGARHVLLGQLVCHWTSPGTQLSPVAPHNCRMQRRPTLVTGFGSVSPTAWEAWLPAEQAEVFTWRTNGYEGSGSKCRCSAESRTWHPKKYWSPTAAWQSPVVPLDQDFPCRESGIAPVRRSSHNKTFTHRSVLQLITDFRSFSYRGWRTHPHSGRTTMHKGKHKRIILGAWNVRTLLKRATTPRPERGTALVASELQRYRVDIAALSDDPDCGRGFPERRRRWLHLLLERKAANRRPNSRCWICHQNSFAEEHVCATRWNQRAPHETVHPSQQDQIPQIYQRLRP